MWRVTVLEELITWFDGPNSLVELFLNYDMDRKFIQQWKIFEQTCNAFCAIAEGRGEDSDPRVREKVEDSIIILVNSIFSVKISTRIVIPCEVFVVPQG